MSSVLDDLIQAELQAKGQGSEVTAAAVATAIGQMTSSQKSQVREDLRAAPAHTVTVVTGATPTIIPADNTIYKCGELMSLTISNSPANGSYSIVFTSGATATTTTLPTDMVFPEAFAPEANTRYEINCVDGYALAVGWPYTPPAAEE